jgi:hypothetical protein
MAKWFLMGFDAHQNRRINLRGWNMDALEVCKAVCSVMSVLAGLVSCFYWLKSAQAEVPFSEAEGTDDMGYELNGHYIAIVATSRKQSRLSARGAIFSAAALIFQASASLIAIFSPGS